LPLPFAASISLIVAAIFIVERRITDTLGYLSRLLIFAFTATFFIRWCRVRRNCLTIVAANTGIRSWVDTSGLIHLVHFSPL
jgi:hypothetical protein